MVCEKIKQLITSKLACSTFHRALNAKPIFYNCQTAEQRLAPSIDVLYSI